MYFNGQPTNRAWVISQGRLSLKLGYAAAREKSGGIPQKNVSRMANVQTRRYLDKNVYNNKLNIVFLSSISLGHS